MAVSKFKMTMEPEKPKMKIKPKVKAEDTAAPEKPKRKMVEETPALVSSSSEKGTKRKLSPERERPLSPEFERLIQKAEQENELLQHNLAAFSDKLESCRMNLQLLMVSDIRSLSDSFDVMKKKMDRLCEEDQERMKNLPLTPTSPTAPAPNFPSPPSTPKKEEEEKKTEVDVKAEAN